MKKLVIDQQLVTTNPDHPALLYNDSSRNVKVLSSVVHAMDSCDRFDFSVAFITMGGLNALYQSFRNIQERGVKGRILTTDYLTFNDPNALEWLLEKTDVEVRICEERFHTKGYIFYNGDSVTSFVGSSNLTDEALCVNLEWNLKVSTHQDDKLTKSILAEFERMWASAVPLTHEWISEYRIRYESHRAAVNSVAPAISGEKKEIEPNSMQTEALESLRNLREDGKTRALLISATGTGKTYLSAFDVREFSPKRVLFLVHNENILKTSKESYQKVLGSKYTYGFYTGNEKSPDSTALFSTIQTMHKRVELFSRDHFDYIVCDEAHHSTAKMYSTIVSYFHPKFMLGMTATPERTDDADVFAMFDYNIAYEIRLNTALEMGILCPFHYFGVSEIKVEGKLIDDNSSFSALTSNERIKNVIEKAEYYQPYGKKVHGLVFCSTADECITLSKLMNEKMRGGIKYNTVALTDKSTIEERKDAIDRVQLDDGDYLDYIFVVNVFNEGIDIPKINQILMLRPTQSAIIFVQQLGRGLRKTDDPNKSLIVLDFIGNYENNFLIPVALSGDRSHDKDNLRRFMMSRYLPGCSTVGFEKIVEDRILSNINRTNLSKLTRLKSEYLLMKVRLGHSPSLCDLLHGGSLDPTVIVGYAKNLNVFRAKAKDNPVTLSEADNDILSFVSSFVDGKRPHELLILSKIIETGEVLIDNFSDMEQDSVESAISVLSGSYQTVETQKNHPYWKVIRREGNKLVICSQFKAALENDSFAKLTRDAIQCGLEINLRDYSNPDDFGFVLYEKYSRADVCRILNWDSDVNSAIYGYMIKNNQCPIFVTINKREDISSSTKYDEYFEDETVLNWMSKPSRTLQSSDVVKIINSPTNGVKLLLFVKKSDSEGTDYYYLGQVEPVSSNAYQTTIAGKSVVKLPLYLKDPISEEFYRYISAPETISS